MQEADGHDQISSGHGVSVEFKRFMFLIIQVLNIFGLKGWRLDQYPDPCGHWEPIR